MRIAVMGTGGVGGYYGALLAKKDHEVAFIARGAHLDAIRRHGLQIKTAAGESWILSARATDKPEEIGSVDLLLFCTKTYDTEAAAQQSKALVGPTTTVVSLQNGLDAHEQIGGVVGMQHMIAGVTGILASLEAPGIIRNGSEISWIVVGELDGRRTERVQAVSDAFDGTGVDLEISENILAELWRKLLIVAPLAACGSLTRLPVGDYRAVPETRMLITRLKQEIAALAAADHAALESGAVEDTLAGLDQLPPLWRSSMQRDIESGHRSEIEAIIGIIGHKGREVGIPTPVADMVYGALLPVDLKTRAQ